MMSKNKTMKAKIMKNIRTKQLSIVISRKKIERAYQFEKKKKKDPKWLVFSKENLRF